MRPASRSTARTRLLAILAAVAAFFLTPPGPAFSEQQILQIGGGTIEIDVDGGFGQANPELMTWIRNAARAVSAYYGGFPVKRLRLHVHLRDGSGVHGGRANGWGRLPTINVNVGRNGGPHSLDDDWVLTHEMIHLGFPNIRGSHTWMEEGLATYAEPIARARIGTMTVDRFWFELMRDMPQGLPGPDDAGFDQTQSWAATYWGGALFWFLADIEIRQATAGRRSLEDALRAIIREGGSIQQEWSVAEILRVGDRATGVNVLSRLYDDWGRRRGSVDFPLLLKRLGVSRSGGRMVYNDNAPLASIRKALTRSPR